MARRVAAVRTPAGRGKRAEQNAQNRLALIRAAAEVVGDFGYQEASVARIVDRAGLSNSTFYTQFSSRQDILDQLLPFVGEEIFRFVGAQVSGARSFVEVEERGLRAYFEYALAHRSYLRILREAEVFAPDAYRVHVDSALDHFTASLRRSYEAGQLDDYEEEELPILAHVLLSARQQLCVVLLEAQRGHKALADKLVRTHVNFISRGLAPRTAARPVV